MLLKRPPDKYNGKNINNLHCALLELKKIKTSNGCRAMKEERCTDNINKGKIANNLYCALLELKKN
jgi:hypothetical protein